MKHIKLILLIIFGLNSIFIINNMDSFLDLIHSFNISDTSIINFCGYIIGLIVLSCIIFSIKSLITMIKTEAKADEYRNFSMKVGDEVYVSAFIGDCTITKIDDEFVTVTTKVYKHNIYNK